MKNKIISVMLLFIIFSLFSMLKLFSFKPKEHKVLKIIRPDLFYVDINDDSKIDDNELFKLKDIYTFSDELNNFVIYNSPKVHLSVPDYLKIGFISQNWANDNLLNQNILITSITEDKTKNYNYITAAFKGKDLSEFYLENGLAFSIAGSNYSIYQNNNRIKANINEISKLDFVLLNLNTNVYHKLNCEIIDLMHNAKIILKKDAKNYIPCKYCHNNISLNLPEIPSQNKSNFYQNFNNFQLYFTNPVEAKSPDDTCSNSACKRLVSEINNSKTSIDIALYGLGDIDAVYKALLNAKNRGVKIRAVMDYSLKMSTLYPKTLDFIKDFNAHTDKSEKIMHNKFFIFDDKLLMTGSANISPSGIGGYSANSIVFLKSDKIINRYKNEFEQMYNGKFSNSKSKFETVKDDNIDVYFSPKDDIKNLIVSKINSAQDIICVSAFYLTQRDIINALISARNRGVKVYIILDAVSANNFKDRVYLMRKGAIALIVENWGGKNHEKTIMIDNKILILGSLNFSQSAISNNDENVLIIEDEKAAKFYKNYFFYLFNSIDKKYLKLIPRAEGKESPNSCSDGVDNNFDGKIDNEDLGCR